MRWCFLVAFLLPACSSSTTNESPQDAGFDLASCTKELTRAQCESCCQQHLPDQLSLYQSTVAYCTKPNQWCTSGCTFGTPGYQACVESGCNAYDCKTLASCALNCPVS